MLLQGGIFEVLAWPTDQIRPSTHLNEDLVRLAFATDVLSGLRQTLSLQGLDSLEFTIPFDRFTVPVTGSTGFLRDLQRSWQSGHLTTDAAPYNKTALVRDHTYVRYTDNERSRLYRVSSLDDQDEKNLTGTAADAAILLSDYLTQYKAGTSTFVGQLPSEIAQRILDGYQQIKVVNRRFSPDIPIRLITANEVPDMTPSTSFTQPLPMVTELQPISPDDAGLFSGLPYETVGPSGTDRSLPTGSVGLFSYNDPGSFSPGTGGIGGLFTDLVNTSPFPAPLNFESSSTPFTQDEQLGPVTHVLYGCVKAAATGLHAFTLWSRGGARVYFRGQMVVDGFFTDYDVGPTSSTAERPHTWQADLVASTWYPFVFHHRFSRFLLNPNPVQVVRFTWATPGASTAESTRVVVPAANLSSVMVGGFFPVRFVDTAGVIRYFHAFKHWDGTKLVLAAPIYSIFPDTLDPTLRTLWPKGVPAGTLVEEVKLPIEHPQAAVLDWGSGWTRRSGPIENYVVGPHVVRFAGKVDDGSVYVLQ